MFAVYHCRHMPPRISPIKRFAIDYFSAGIRICIFDDYVWIIWKPAFAEFPRKRPRAWFAGVLGLSIELGGTISHVENNDAKLMRDDLDTRREIWWSSAGWWMSQSRRVVWILMRLSACSEGRGWGLDQLPTSYSTYTIGCHTILSVLPWAGCVATWLNPSDIKLLRFFMFSDAKKDLPFTQQPSKRTKAIMPTKILELMRVTLCSRIVDLVILLTIGVLNKLENGGNEVLRVSERAA